MVWMSDVWVSGVWLVSGAADSSGSMYYFYSKKRRPITTSDNKHLYTFTPLTASEVEEDRRISKVKLDADINSYIQRFGGKR